MSADFVNHPTADLMQSALLLHDQAKFDIFLYSISRDDSSVYRSAPFRCVRQSRPDYETVGT